MVAYSYTFQIPFKKDIGCICVLKLSIYTNNNNNRTYNIEICKVDKKRKDCQTETLIDLCKLKIGVVQQRVLTTKLGQSRDLATANYSRHIARKATYIHTTCILATKPSMLSITIQFHVLKVKLVIFCYSTIYSFVTQHFFKFRIISTEYQTIQ